MFTKIKSIATIVLILLNFTLIFIKADDDEGSKVFNVVRRNWLDHNQTFWLHYDPHGDSLIYIFHSENVEQKLAFKQDIINWSTLSENGAVLSFQYWANNELGHLRSKPDTAKAIELLLDRANQWTDAKICELSQKAWNNLTLISGGDEYTLALKDVHFSYTDLNHLQVKINCSESIGCSNIFDRPLPQSKEKINTELQFMPYQRNNTQPNLNQPPQTYLQVNRPQTKHANDFCINFYYTASSGPLFVSAEVSSAHSLAVEFPTKTNSAESRQETICASTFTPNLNESLRALYFWFSNDKPIDLLDSNYVSLVTNTQPEVKNTLSDGIILHRQAEKLFQIQASSGYAQFYESSITFIPYYNLQDEKKYIKSQLIQKVEYRSKWVKMSSKRSNQFRITFNQTNKLPDFAQLTMIISAPGIQKLFEKRLESPSLKIFNINFEISAHSPPIPYVQILFSFQIDFSKVKDEKHFEFKLDQFSANDPCVDERGTENECNSRGQCVANYEQFEGICHCDAGYSAKDQCKSKDFCTEMMWIVDGNNTDGHRALALQICKNQGLNCLTNIEKQSFECDCGDSKLWWNPVALSCFPKELVKCPDNQIHKLNDGKLQCVCRYGMRLEPQTNKCVLNVCSEENDQKCAKKGAICGVHSNGTKCECEPGNVAFLANTDRPDEWTCMDRCMVVEHFSADQKDQSLEALQCGHFSKCDPLHVEFGNYYDTHEKIIFKNSNVSVNPNSVCKCDIGLFSWHSFFGGQWQCEPTSESTFILSRLQFEIYPNLTKQIEKQETVDQMISNLFEGIHSNPFLKCEHNNSSSFLVSCDVFLNTDKSPEQITAQLLDHCIPILGSSGTQCVLFTDAIKKEYSNFFYLSNIFTGEVILHVDSVATPKLFSNFCDNKELCPSNFENSICKTTTIGNRTSSFDCVCDLELFDVSSTTWLGGHSDNTLVNAPHSSKIKGEKCKPKNLCQTKSAQFGCKDPTAQCHSVVEYENGTYVPMSFCTCAKTGHVTHDRDYICPK